MGTHLLISISIDRSWRLISSQTHLTRSYRIDRIASHAMASHRITSHHIASQASAIHTWEVDYRNAEEVIQAAFEHGDANNLLVDLCTRDVVLLHSSGDTNGRNFTPTFSDGRGVGFGSGGGVPNSSSGGNVSEASGSAKKLTRTRSIKGLLRRNDSAAGLVSSVSDLRGLLAADNVKEDDDDENVEGVPLSYPTDVAVLVAE